MSATDFNAFNKGIVDEFRANHGVVGGPFDGAPMILVTHKGAKSGVERTSPLVYTRDGDGVVIIASMGGAPTHPAWFHNIKANPQVQVEVGDESYTANAEILTEGPERQRLFDQQAALMPNFKEYQEKTDRVIPVVVLTQGLMVRRFTTAERRARLALRHRLVPAAQRRRRPRRHRPLGGRAARDGPGDGRALGDGADAHAGPGGGRASALRRPASSCG